ncbi:MAG: hypothetical protein CSA32_01190 [Desulfobulbus propionicus]|nr:MAG: hypothetical protein CSA32_01190 [Desulfobulbus propionicus]
MKIAIIHNQFIRSGGMESYLLTVLRGFLDAGDEVHLHVYKVDRQLVSQFTCRLHFSSLFFLPRRIRKYLFLHRYNQTFSAKDYDLSLSLTRTSCQDVAVVGGVHPQSVLTRKSRNIFRRLHDQVEIAFEGKMLRTVPWIVAHSKIIRDEILSHYNIAADKIRILYPPIDEKRFVFPYGQEQEQPLFVFSEHKTTLLFPSMDHRRKGLEELLLAYEQLDPERYELVIVGNSGARMGHRNNIRYLGYIREMNVLYRAVDYVVLPSHYEPFGLVVAEALQCGTPVIVTRAVGAAELLTEDEGVILPDNDPVTLVEAISRLEPKKVPPDFVGRHGLGTFRHIQALKELVSAD